MESVRGRVSVSVRVSVSGGELQRRSSKLERESVQSVRIANDIAR